MNLFSQHRDPDNIPSRAFFFHFERLRPVIELLVRKDRLLENWYLKGDNLEEALKYRAYEDDRPTKDAVNEVADRYKGKGENAPKTIGIWNGIQSDDSGAAFSISIDGDRLLPQSFELAIDEKNHVSSRLGGFRSVAEVVGKIAEIYDPFYVTFGPRKYFEKQVFDDRPGVSWMLYLPHVLTPTQVPEARALIPVMRDGKQQGTIIVSVTDEVFDVNNRAHVKVANDIEIRLADQDLLPRFIDL
ncbi:immunity 52 family protein [Paraburkholderia sp. MMS20-SJTN17]|uniref:Immunity 52 family protein n=1 Tax=Paraburkholderia translucens TaxID=2886945 RepID=A0ABS8KD92_9BURK|nr:immunity 52 family protein [Paraburkholderia sp. MMS20-SJTN17]MCC8402731.1 immunity 52 family protein [Paraburkholderia sp. MMS20-SJTN17]